MTRGASEREQRGTNPAPAPGSPLWTARQRGVLIALLLALWTYFAVRYAQQPTFVSTPQPDDGVRAADLADRLDPNTATAAEIAAIPEIGDKLSQTLVDYRRQYQLAHPNDPAFARPDDLRHVKGIGTAKSQAMAPYLRFPATRPAGAAR